MSRGGNRGGVRGSEGIGVGVNWNKVFVFFEDAVHFVDGWDLLKL